MNDKFFNNNKTSRKINKSYELEHHSTFNKIIQDSYISKTKKNDINNLIFINDIQSIYYINNILLFNENNDNTTKSGKNRKYKKLLNNELIEKTIKINNKIDEYLSC